MPEHAVSIRSIAPSVFLPALVFEIGNGAIAPVVALTALDEGASSSTAGFMLALLGIGQILGDIPAGALAHRIGDRRAMMLAAGLAVAALAVCGLSHSLVLLGAGLVAIGVASATYYLGRQNYLGEIVPPSMRARAMSTLGGSHRIGLFLGPFVGAAAISVGGLRSAYLVAVCAATAAAVLLVVIPDVASTGDRRPAARGDVSSLTMLRVYRRLFATLGLGVIAVGAVRAARQTVLPLWASHLGLSPEQTSVMFGIASAVDMALFYPAGKVMDRFGRLWIALPSMTILGLGMVAIPLTRGMVTLTAVAMVMSLGNGIGSGIMMTLGVDAAPVDGRVRFLAVWRLFGDFGNALGPMAVSVVTSLVTLAAGIGGVGGVGLLAAAALARSVPTYSPYATRRSVARNRQSAAPAAPGSSGPRPGSAVPARATGVTPDASGIRESGADPGRRAGRRR